MDTSQAAPLRLRASARSLGSLLFNSRAGLTHFVWGLAPCRAKHMLLAFPGYGHTVPMGLSCLQGAGMASAVQKWLKCFPSPAGPGNGIALLSQCCV